MTEEYKALQAKKTNATNETEAITFARNENPKEMMRDTVNGRRKTTPTNIEFGCINTRERHPNTNNSAREARTLAGIISKQEKRRPP